MKVLVVAVVIISVASAYGEDFFWRDFNGTAPRDAVKVYDKYIGTVYIGQGYVPDVGLLPGLIRNGLMEMTVVTNRAIYIIRDNIKILAFDSIRPEADFQWIKTNYQNFDSLKSLNFLNVIKGGTENNSDLYIGRHSEAEYMNIGKISTLEPYQGLSIPDAQGKPTIYKNFEVLTMLNFDCSESSKRTVY